MIFLISNNITGMAVHNEEIMLGYCPSMEPEAIKISKLNKNIKIIRKESTIDALNSLKKGEIDIALTGRIAKESEFNGKKRIIGSGYTLAGNTKKIVQKDELKSLKVHTALKKETANQLLPESEITYHDSFENAILQGINDAVLIDWENYTGAMEIIIVMNGESKAKEFRIPVLYSLNQDIGKIKTET